MSTYADKAPSTPVDDRQNAPRRDFAKHPAAQRSGLSRLRYVFITN